ncbi:hypothetical protein [Pseudoclavibacter terrae]|uniref:Uncharacterized protein n=1 Tax=Pseudoclavibacter terrae TaxID=1530195 RepID=A0A7J5AZ09_9MICO|nr:hypothetical protein [Pseudoclavibacter terrae]KAB1636292.1 hypothetical protein F8O03_17420 [Pseudoclavibacter terrae]
MTEEPKNDERVEPAEPADDYDPMIYDAMREAANRLGGLYMERWHQARTTEERDLWLQKNIAVSLEADAVDSYSLAEVQAKRAELVRRFEAEDRRA